MSGSTSTPPYAMSPIGPNGLPLLEFIQPLPQATVQLSFPTLAETIAENIAASGVLTRTHPAAAAALSRQPLRLPARWRVSILLRKGLRYAN